MADRLSIAVTLVIVAIIVYLTFSVGSQLDDPEYMCQSAFGEEWTAAENSTPPNDGWVCEAPNGTVRRLKFVNVTSDMTEWQGGWRAAV